MTLYQHPFWWVIARRDLQRFALRAGDWAEVRSYEWDDPAFFFFRIPIVVASYLTGDIAAGDRAIENLLEIESNGDSQTHQMMNTMLTWLQAVRVYVTGEERWLRDCEKRTVRGCEQAGNQRHLAQYSICGGRIVRFALNEEQARAFYRTLREAERYYFEEEEYSIAAAKALLALKWGDADLARQHFQEAVAFCDKYEEKPWRAWYLYELARLLEGQEPGRAQALAEEALLEARRLGLNPLVQRIESEQASGARRLAGAIGAADARRELGITSREQEVLALLVRGLTDKEIAAELALSPFTVSNHLRNIYAKIGCNTRGEAVHWALSCGLVAVE
jgi:DNA-binding CsgD family transcriptional regulator/ribosomal protein S18 acetylase RimI-like enzyme